MSLRTGLMITSRAGFLDWIWQFLTVEQSRGGYHDYVHTVRPHEGTTPVLFLIESAVECAVALIGY